MSQELESSVLSALYHIERQLAESAESKRSNVGSDTVPAHELLECLKAPSGKADSRGNDLTELGALLYASLPNEKHFEALGWIVFHLSLPISFRSMDTVATRNWIALRTGDTDIIDAIHERELSEGGAEHIADIYAPSILAQRLRGSDIEAVGDLSEKAWLYRLSPIERHEHGVQHSHCLVPSSNEITRFVCFSPLPNGHVVVSSCASRMATASHTPCTTLGRLLGEDESTAGSRFKTFSDLVRLRRAEEFPGLPDPGRAVKCNFYARVPMFYACGSERFMTEVFLAIQVEDNNIEEAAHITLRVESILRIVVSLVNSQVGYNVASFVRRATMARLGHAVLRHDLKNLAESVQSQVRLALELVPTDGNSADALVRRALLSVRADTLLSMMANSMDVLWDPRRECWPNERNTLRKMARAFGNCWKIAQVESCEFIGPWDDDSDIPELWPCHIVMANLMRNAIAQPENRSLRLEVVLEDCRVEFGCLSECPIDDDKKKQFFEAELESDPPTTGRGIWICRYLSERLLGGELWLGDPFEAFRANVRFSFPLNEGR